MGRAAMAMGRAAMAMGRAAMAMGRAAMAMGRAAIDMERYCLWIWGFGNKGSGFWQQVQIMTNTQEYQEQLFLMGNLQSCCCSNDKKHLLIEPASPLLKQGTLVKNICEDPHLEFYQKKIWQILEPQKKKYRQLRKYTTKNPLEGDRFEKIVKQAIERNPAPTTHLLAMMMDKYAGEKDRNRIQFDLKDPFVILKCFVFLYTGDVGYIQINEQIYNKRYKEIAQIIVRVKQEMIRYKQEQLGQNHMQSRQKQQRQGQKQFRQSKGLLSQSKGQFRQSKGQFRQSKGQLSQSRQFRQSQSKNQQKYIQSSSATRSLKPNNDIPNSQFFALYRGIKQNPNMVTGEKLFWRGFTSTSRNNKVAQSFGQHYIFNIKLDTNRPHDYLIIPEKLSQHPKQEQVLLFPYFHFRCDKVNKLGNVIKYDLMQIPK